MKSLRMVTNGNIKEFYFTVTHNWKTRTTPPPPTNLIYSFLIQVSTMGALKKSKSIIYQYLGLSGQKLRFPESLGFHEDLIR